MSDKWRDLGNADNPLETLFGFMGHKEAVENAETREIRTVFVAPGQTTGDAIAKGQFTDKPTSTGRSTPEQAQTVQTGLSNAPRDSRRESITSSYESTETCSAGSYGGSSDGGGYSYPEGSSSTVSSEGTSGVFFWIFVVPIIAVITLSLLTDLVDKGINLAVPKYVTRQEANEQWKKEWQQVKNFFAGSDKQLIVAKSKSPPPEAILQFLATVKNGRKRIVRVSVGRIDQSITTGMSIGKYEDMYNRKWVPTGVSGTSRGMQQTSSWRSSPVPSPSGERRVHLEGNYIQFHWGSTMDGTGYIVLRDSLTQTSKSHKIGYAITQTTLTPQAWSPDSNKVVLGVSGPAIEVIDWNGEVYCLAAHGKNPAWSPCGKWIAFEYQGEIFLFDIGTVDPKTIRSRPLSDSYLEGGESSPIASGNIIRIGTGEKPLWVQ